MALADEAKRVSALFDYSDHNVNEGVVEFLRQMSESLPLPVCPARM